MLIRLSSVMLVLAAVALGTPVKRDAVTVQWDINDMTDKTKSLDNTIVGLPSDSVTNAQMLSVHNAVVALETAVDTATNDASASSDFTDSESNTLMQLVNILKPAVLGCLNDLESKKDAISASDAGPSVKSDLEGLLAKTDAFGQALLTKLPESDQGLAGQQLSAINSAFTDAIAMFS